MRDIPCEINISFSDSISIHRKRLKLNQSELAEAAGISRNYISLIERGYIDNVSLKVLNRICNRLGLELKITYSICRLQKHVYIDGVCAECGDVERTDT